VGKRSDYPVSISMMKNLEYMVGFYLQLHPMWYSVRFSVVNFEVVEFAMTPTKENKARYSGSEEGEKMKLEIMQRSYI
jgi:hypothetical protein